MTTEQKRFYQGQTRARLQKYAKAEQRKEIIEALIGTVMIGIFAVMYFVIL